MSELKHSKAKNTEVWCCNGCGDMQAGPPTGERLCKTCKADQK